MNPGWLKELAGEHISETEEYGISSFVFSSNKIFDHTKLFEINNNNKLTGVIRSKGFAWVNNQYDLALMWNHSGNIINFDPYGTWQKDSTGQYMGEQKIVFIGIDMNKYYIIDILNSALVD